MSYRKLIVSTCLAVVIIGLASVVASIAVAADAAKEGKPAGLPEMKLPPGWTEEDMKACMIAGTPGKMHELLTKEAAHGRGSRRCGCRPPPRCRR